jgi:hypothetical protein
VTDAGSHIYTSATIGELPFVVTVTITKHASNSLGSPVTETGEAIGNVAVSLSTLHATFSAFAPVAGMSYDGPVATFTDDQPVPALENNPDADPNNYYTATIDWGDGTSGLGTIIETNSAATAFAVIGSHTYKFPTTGASPAIVSVTIVKNYGSEAALVAGNVAVADALLFPYAQNVSYTATEGALFAGDGEVAQFTDNDPFVTAASFNGPTASQTVIAWGDGKSSVGVIVPDPVLPGVFDIVGSHIYASPTAAGVPNTISVTVLDQWGGKTTITNNVVVVPAPLTISDLTLPVNLLVPIVATKSFTSDITRFTSSTSWSQAASFFSTQPRPRSLTSHLSTSKSKISTQKISSPRACHLASKWPNSRPRIPLRQQAISAPRSIGATKTLPTRLPIRRPERSSKGPQIPVPVTPPFM